jgi:Dienelactone hydrolase family
MNSKSESYTAGFKTIHTVDKSRVYNPKTDTTDHLHYRPVDLDIWYPSNHSPDTPLLVRDLLGLLESRANFYSASNLGNGVAAQLAQFFCETFKCSDSTRLLNFKTSSFRNATAIEGKYPLVIYMTAFDGMSYENFALFETLVQKGFVVLSVSSIGRFPGNMTTQKEDLMEQVNDAMSALNTLKDNSIIDFNEIGIVGYSWGGLAGAILASKMPDVKCLVSLDGSEFHHYGNEDTDFETIKNSEEFKNINLSIPYLRLESAPAIQPEKGDSVYDFSLNHANNAEIFAIDSMQHVDFDCFSRIVKESGKCNVSHRYNSALEMTVSFLGDNLKNQNNFSATVDDQIHKVIRRK